MFHKLNRKNRQLKAGFQPSIDIDIGKALQVGRKLRTLQLIFESLEVAQIANAVLTIEEGFLGEAKAESL